MTTSACAVPPANAQLLYGLAVEHTARHSPAYGKPQGELPELVPSDCAHWRSGT